LAALLAVSPLPPRPTPTATAPAQDGGAALPRAGDLTLAQPAGEVLVGLTIRPARPGRNQLLLHLLPLDGEQAAGRLPVAVQLAGSTITPQPCGPACRHATATLHGGEPLRVVVGGAGGGAQAAVDRLHSLLHKGLRSGVVMRWSLPGISVAQLLRTPSP
jgi:hypothetical protein